MTVERKRLLLVRLNDIGEVVMATAAIAAARAVCPDAYIAALTACPSDALLHNDPNLDHLYVCDKRKWRHGKHTEFLSELASLIRALRADRFDAAIDLQNTPSTHWLLRASGAQVRVGVAARNRSARLHTHQIAPSNDWLVSHQVDRFRYILSQYLGQLPPSQPRIHVSDSARKSVDEKLRAFPDGGADNSNAPIVCLQPGAGLAERCWPVDRFAEIAVWLAQERQATVWVHAGPGEEPIARAIQERESTAHVLSGLTLPELAAVLERSNLMVTNDSGPMHMAAALQTKQVVIFGSTNPRVSGPYAGDFRIVSKNLPCAPCGRFKFECEHHNCLHTLPVEDVRRAIEEALDE